MVINCGWMATNPISKESSEKFPRSSRTMQVVVRKLDGLIWEEPSMDQQQSRGKLLKNFQYHCSIQMFPENKAPKDWSIRISLEIHMDQWLPNLSESCGLHRHRSIECSSLWLTIRTKLSAKLERQTLNNMCSRLNSTCTCSQVIKTCCEWLGTSSYSDAWDEVFSPIRSFHPGFVKGQKKHINFFNINSLPPTQNTPFWTPREKFMCLMSWERTQKRDPHKLFSGRNLGSKRGSQTGHFRPQKALVYCFCSLLVFALFLRADFREGDEDSNCSVFRVQPFSEWLGPLSFLYKS